MRTVAVVKSASRWYSLYRREGLQLGLGLGSFAVVGLSVKGVPLTVVVLLVLGRGFVSLLLHVVFRCVLYSRALQRASYEVAEREEREAAGCSGQ